MAGTQTSTDCDVVRERNTDNRAAQLGERVGGLKAVLRREIFHIHFTEVYRIGELRRKARLHPVPNGVCGTENVCSRDWRQRVNHDAVFNLLASQFHSDLNLHDVGGWYKGHRVPSLSCSLYKLVRGEKEVTV